VLYASMARETAALPGSKPAREPPNA